MPNRKWNISKSQQNIIDFQNFLAVNCEIVDNKMINTLNR